MTSTFLLGYRAWSLFFMVSALFVGLSRIFLGVHYLGDVVAGWIVGGVLSLLVISILRRHPKIKDLLNEGAS